MLVLKRRQGQEIVIEDQTGGQVRGQIRIVVVQTGEGSCSLAFEAPRECRIRRAELPVFGDTGNTVTGSVGSSVSGSVSGSVGFDSATNLQEKFPAVDSANARSAAVPTAAVPTAAVPTAAVPTAAVSTAAAESSAQQAAAQQVLVQKAVSRRQQVGLSSGSSLRQALLRRSHSPVPVLPDSVLSELSSAEAVLQVQS